MDLFLAMVPNSLPLFSSSKTCFASFSVLTTMTRSKTSSRPPDCALEIVDEWNDRNRIGTMANTRQRLRKSEILFLAVWLSMAVVDAWNCNQIKLADTCSMFVGFRSGCAIMGQTSCFRERTSSRGILGASAFDQTTRRIFLMSSEPREHVRLRNPEGADASSQRDDGCGGEDWTPQQLPDRVANIVQQPVQAMNSRMSFSILALQPRMTSERKPRFPSAISIPCPGQIASVIA